MAPRTAPPPVAGADGCRGGWCLAWEPDGPERAPQVAVVPTFAELLERTTEVVALGVDAPIGLPERYERGGRACDREARRLLGPRRGASVFPAPSRAVLRARDHAEACALNRDASGAAVGLSVQTYNLVPKLREVDAALTAADHGRVYEVHPELSFRALAGAPVLAPKRTREGLAVRLGLLVGVFGPSVRELVDATRGPLARDDVVDALAVLWSARRIARGQAEALPAVAPRDARGLVMQIRF